jgi:hypothetical protein
LRVLAHVFSGIRPSWPLWCCVLRLMDMQEHLDDDLDCLLKRQGVDG